MTVEPDGLEVLVSLADEFEAAAIVGDLEAHGVAARAVGGFTAGYRAESPGDVRVVVARGDLRRAQQVLAELRQQQAGVDWSEAESGSPGEDADEEDDRASRSAKPTWDGPAQPYRLNRRRFQYSLATLLFAQAAVSVALASWRGLGPEAIMPIVIVGTMFTLAVSGTVWVACHMSQTREAFAYVVRVSAVVLAGTALLVLIFWAIRWLLAGVL